MQSLRHIITCSALFALSAGTWSETANKGDELVIHGQRPLPSWRVIVADFEAQQTLTGHRTVTVPKPARARVPQSRVAASRAADQDRDALTLQWKDAWYAALRIEDAAPLDLSSFIPDGALVFDINVLELADGGVTVKLGCGEGCERKVPYVLPARAMAGRGWQTLAFSMSCFARESDDFRAVTQPFVLEGSGTGRVSIANVRFARHAKPNASCPDYKTESITPAMLSQPWSLHWWEPRHRQKQEEAKQRQMSGRPIELVFIGDSITQGWEKEGAGVWKHHYEPHNALQLGFGGDHTENVLWRLQNGALDGLAPKVVVLMMGTNNTGSRQENPATTAAGIRRNVDEIRKRLPDTKILLLAVFPRDARPDSPLRRINDRINTLIAGMADDSAVHFLDINAALMNRDGSLSRDVMPDLLHLSEKGYSIWAEHMNPTLNRLMTASDHKTR